MGVIIYLFTNAISPELRRRKKKQMKNEKYHKYLSIPTDEEVGGTSPLRMRDQAQRREQSVQEWKNIAITLGIVAFSLVLAAVFLGVYAVKHDEHQNDADHHH